MFNRLKPKRLLSDDAGVVPGVWNVRIIDNAGRSTGVYQYSYNSALAYALLIMMPDIHIIIIERDHAAFQRFDRARILDSNDWCEVDDLSAPEPKGLFINLLA